MLTTSRTFLGAVAQKLRSGDLAPRRASVARSSGVWSRPVTLFAAFGVRTSKLGVMKVHQRPGFKNLKKKNVSDINYPLIIRCTMAHFPAKTPV